ncbi:MAG: sensor domain-containing diguanylate cyclase [Gemmatimonadaceae bacterium]
MARPEPTEPNDPISSHRSLDDAATAREFLHKVGEGIYISDLKGRILDANPAFLEIFGVASLTELATRDVSHFLADPDRRQLELSMLERDGAVKEFELEVVRPDGQRRFVRDTMFGMRDPVTGEQYIHGILVDITRSKDMEERLREQLIRDALTGCYNRRFLLDLVERMNADVGGESRWGCLFIDIDRFKLYNDTYGHRSGDHVLQKIARFLLQQVRAEEAVIRIGGDEFLIVLTGENATRTEAVAKRLQRTAARSAPVPFSLGWAVRVGNEKLDATIDRADKNLIEVRVLSRSGEWPELPTEMERRKRGPTP